MRAVSHVAWAPRAARLFAAVAVCVMLAGCTKTSEEEAKALCDAGAAGVGVKLADKGDTDIKALAAAATALGAYECAQRIKEYGTIH
jgi:ABC-type uncharacterized transport system auxiliary subunit